MALIPSYFPEETRTGNTKIGIVLAIQIMVCYIATGFNGTPLLSF
jgi:hypothetical protein